MSADFTPNVSAIGQRDSFRLWCQKVLPTVFDGSLTYYEMLCKIARTLNDIIEGLNEYDNNMASLVEAYKLLEGYVNTYFDTLDVSKEINAKLDNMANDGTLNELLKPIVDTRFALLEQSVDVLDARVTNFTALPNGSTTGDAELIDIRVGSNGVTYSSAGEAVRKQLNQIKDRYLGQRDSISAGVDYNTLTKTGIYFVNASSVAGSSNMPINSNGVLTVKSSQVGTDNWIVEQSFFSANGKIFTRYKSSASWGDWVEQVNANDDILRYVGYIESAVDYNTLVKTGYYNVNLSSISGSTNLPCSLGGVLTIKNVGDGNIVVQEYITYTNKLYTRYKTNSGWTEWVERITLDAFDVIEKHTDGIGALVEVAQTYFDVAYDPDDQLLYHTTRGLFNSKVTDDSGIKSLVCSQFLCACLSAILYQNSRYVGDKNESLEWGWSSDGTGNYDYTDWNPDNDYMTANNMARYFASKGLLIPFNPKRNTLQPGDIVFYRGGNAPDYYYEEITHVGVCLSSGNTGHTIMHSNDGHMRLVDGKEAGVMVTRYLYSSFAPSHYVKSPIMAEYKTELLVDKVVNSVGDYSGSLSGYITTLNLGTLERGFYTVKYADSGDSEGYIKVHFANGTTKDINADKRTGVNKIVFYAEMPISKIDVRVIGGSNWNCERVKMYKGYHN